MASESLLGLDGRPAAKPEQSAQPQPKGSWALTCFRQAVMVLCWLPGERDIPKLGRDHRVSRATAYRYVDEAVAVLAVRFKHPISTRRWSGLRATATPM